MEKPTENDVYVDVLFDEGLLYLVICNDGAHAATEVRVAFRTPLLGAGGKDITQIGAFTNLDFLAPAKRLPVFLNDARAHFARRQPSRIAIKVTWRVDRTRLTSSMTHDMRAYADLPYVAQHGDTRRLGQPRL